MCTVVHTTAKTSTITTVAHVRPHGSCTAVQSSTAAAAAIHVVFPSSSMTSRLIRYPRTRRLRLLLTVKILVPTTVVRQAAIAIFVRLIVVNTVSGLVCRSHAHCAGGVA